MSKLRYFRRKRDKSYKKENIPSEAAPLEKIEKKIKTEDENKEFLQPQPHVPHIPLPHQNIPENTFNSLNIVPNNNNMKEIQQEIEVKAVDEPNIKLLEQFRKLEEEINKIQGEVDNRPESRLIQEQLDKDNKIINALTNNENEEKNKEEGELDIKKNETFAETEQKNIESLKKRGSESSEKKKNKKKDKKQRKKKERKTHKKKDRKRSRSRSRSRKNRKSYDSDSSD